MSASYNKFLENMVEIENLSEMHSDITNGNVGKPNEKVHVLNKAGFVLICAFWQSYCEEVLFEAMNLLCSGNAAKVPPALQVALGNRAAGDRKNIDPQRYWNFAGKGWKSELAALISHLQGDLTRPLDNPKSANVDAVFKTYLGIKDLSSQWYWPAMSVKNATQTVDNAIKRRHRLAHRGADATTIQKRHVTKFANHVRRLAEKTDNYLSREGFVK